MCYINVQHWLLPMDQKPMVVLSTNSEEMIRNSTSASSPFCRVQTRGTTQKKKMPNRRYIVHWKPCAITAIVFMACVSFIGWWYQRRMRDLFRQSKLLQPRPNSTLCRHRQC